MADMIDYQSWYLSSWIALRDISDCLSGLGAVLIDGDALIHHLMKSGERDESALRVKHQDFVQKLAMNGLERVVVVFFTKYSKTTTVDENNNILKLALFGPALMYSSWQDQDFLRLVEDEHACSFITSDQNIYNKDGLQFESLHFISKLIPVCLLDESKFENFETSFFVLDPDRRFETLNICTERSQPMLSNTIHSSSNDPKVPNLHQIKCSKLRKILGAPLESIEKVSASSMPSSFAGYANLWTSDIPVRFDRQHPKFQPSKYPNQDNQKYSRFMERYSNSLNAEKHLHHKILVTESEMKSCPKQKEAKLSSKAQAIILAEQKRKREAADVKEMDVFNRTKSSIKTMDHFNEWLLHSELDNYGANFLCNLCKFKISLICQDKSYGESYEQRTAEIYSLIKELFMKYYNLLSVDDIKCYLDQLKHLKFISSAEFFKQHLNQRYLELDDKTRATSLKSVKLNGDSFNADILFQLNYLGDKLERSLNSRVDDRVKFKPDQWQFDLLNIVDRRESAVISAPTSSGKTFISYYAMEKSLRANHSDMVVFIAPNKALANQIVAEIYARFGGKVYPNTTETRLYAMLMPDYSINEPSKCQILVTVPQSFETLLSQKAEWLNKIKYVIMDEIQQINCKKMVNAMEKIIHLVECPLLLLSATIGNLDQFHAWLQSITAAKGLSRVHKIIHTERFCDLKKYLFVPKKIHKEGLLPVHELFGYSSKHLKDLNELSSDFHLLSIEISEILSALDSLATSENQKKLVESVQPNKFFKSVNINKQQVKEYEKFLMSQLSAWYNQNDFSTQQLDQLLERLNGKCTSAFTDISAKYDTKFTTAGWAKSHIYELVNELHQKKMLPAIVFAKTTALCDQLATELCEHLKRLEQESKAAIKIDEKSIKKLEKELKRARDVKKKVQKGNEYEAQEEEERNLQMLSINDENKIDLSFSFLDFKHKATDREIDDEVYMHRHRPNIPPIMFEAWRRGIGVHHAQYHTKFRSSVEFLFRKRHLQVVFATETLSLGINMPCKTVVLTHECIRIDPISYRHMVGRAGRRGFDTHGHIVFFGMPKQKVKNLIASYIPKIRGRNSFEMTTFAQLAVLRALNEEKSLQTVQNIMNNPIMKLTRNAFNDSTLCQKTVGSIFNYFIDKKVMNQWGYASSLVQLILPLRNETRNSSLIILLELVLHGYFDRVVENMREYEAEDHLVAMLCYFVKPKDLPSHHARYARLYSSDIILPDLPELKKFLLEKEREFQAYCKLFANSQQEMEMIERVFPSFHRLHLAKNSYVYLFYKSGNLAHVSSRTGINEGSMYYALKLLRALVFVLIPYFAGKNDQVAGILNRILAHSTLRFRQIVN